MHVRQLGEPVPELELPDGTRKGKQRYPSAPQTGVNFVVDQIEIVQIDGITVMKSARITKERVYRTGERVLFNTSHIRDHIDLRPNFAALGAFAPKMENPILTHRGVPGIEYTWKNGEVVPNPQSDTDFRKLPAGN